MEDIFIFDFPIEFPNEESIIKKKRKTDINKNDITLVKRSVYEIRKISLERFEKETEEIISKNGTLSIAETKEIQRQRKLIKNRIASSVTRARKQRQKEDLEGRIDFLEEERDKLKQQLADLTMENLCLKNEVNKLLNTIEIRMPFHKNFIIHKYSKILS